MNLLLHDPIYGAYTELFAGLSTDIKMSNNGDFSESPRLQAIVLQN